MMYIVNPGKNLYDLFSRKEGTSLLILDYDGTIAPFKIKRNEAIPDPEILEKIDLIARYFPTCRLVIVSGRKAKEVKDLLGLLLSNVEIWGSHGWERISHDGEYQALEPARETIAAMERAAAIAKGKGFGDNCEIKVASIALHTRGLDEVSKRKAEDKVISEWKKIANQSTVSLTEFDGGFELVDRSKNKGTAVKEILDEIPGVSRACYIGDDKTDEDAFRAIASKGFAILYNNKKKETYADIVLESKHELIGFLERWLNVCDGKG